MLTGNERLDLVRLWVTKLAALERKDQAVVVEQIPPERLTECDKNPVLGLE